MSGVIPVMSAPLNSDIVSSSKRWWTYLADYDGLVGSTRVDMDLRQVAPDKDLPYLVILGTSYASSREDKLPDAAEIERLNEISDAIILSVTRLGPAVYAGTFTNDLEQLHFVYVSSLASAEASFHLEHTKQCPCGKPTYIEQHDPNWEQYLGFLYPNQQTIEFYGYDSETNTSTK
jgi:hypothetical protein